MTERRRRRIATVFVLIACLTAPMAVVAIWANRNLLDTERFTSRLAPSIEDPEVQGAIAGFVTTQVLERVDTEALLEEVFQDRPRAEMLVGPLSTAVNGFVRRGVDAFVATDAFATLWRTAIEVAHGQAVRVLEDDSRVLNAVGSVVELNLAPVVQRVLTELADAVPQLVPGPIDPAALEDLGSIVVYDRDRVEAAQQALRRFEQFVWVAAGIAVVSAAVALLLTSDRRRTGLQLAVGLAIGDVLVRRAGMRLVDDIRSTTDETDAAAAAAAILDRFLDPLLTFTLWSAILLLLVSAVLAVTGPYAWAVRLREGAGPGVEWARGNGSIVAGAGVALAIVVLWTVDLSWLAMLVVALGAGAWWLATHRGAPPSVAPS